MDDEEILARGGDENDIKEYAKQNGADWPVPTCASCGGLTIYDPIKYPGGNYCNNKGCPARQNI